MSDSQLNISIKARNQAKAEFDKLDKQVKGLQGKSGVGGLNSALGNLDSKLKATTGMSLGFATGAGLAGAAVMGLVRFMQDAVNESIAYATEIDNLSRLLGLNTEETSRLLQASDDLFISQETLTSGLQAATRKGIDVSIEGLKKLADEYNSLPEGVTRSKFVLDTFGRSGAEMGKLMEVGAEGIEKATAAIADNLIVTKESMRNSMNYKRSIDNVTDAWQGFKYQVGNAVIPQLDLLLRQMTKGEDAVEKYQKKVNELTERIVQLKKYGGQMGMSQEEIAAQIKILEDAIESAGIELDNFVTFEDEAITAQEKLNDRLGTLQTILAGSVGKEISNFNDKLKINAQNTQDIQARIKELNGKVWLTEAQREELGELEQDLIAVKEEAIKLKEEHEIAMRTMAMNMIITKASSDGLTENEVANIGKIMAAWGLWDTETARVVGNINAIDLDDADLEVDDLSRRILGIPDEKHITIRVTGEIEQSAYDAAAFAGQGTNNPYIGKPRNTRASGGAVNSGTPYLIGEVGPELFIPGSSGTVVPNNRLAGAGGAVVNFYYSPAITLSDRTEAETRLVPIIRKALART